MIGGVGEVTRPTSLGNCRRLVRTWDMGIVMGEGGGTKPGREGGDGVCPARALLVCAHVGS